MREFGKFRANILCGTHRQIKALVKDLETPPEGSKDLYFPTQYSQSTWGQFKSCLWKQWWTYWRSPDYNLVRYFFTLAASLVLGTIFWQVGTERLVYVPTPKPGFSFFFSGFYAYQSPTVSYSSLFFYSCFLCLGRIHLISL